MTSIEYIETMVRSCDRIYMDTATLMDTEGLALFISHSTPILEAHERKIIIPKSVLSELARHLGSENHVKANLAMRAIELISQNRNLFQFVNEPMTEEEISHAFADAQILSELTLAKADCSQLLITNDKKLSADAFSLNQQQSSRGFQIRVCYISRSGELRKCECVSASRKRYLPPVESATLVESDDTITHDNHSTKHNPDYEDPASIQGRQSKIWWIVTAVFGCLTFCGGVYLGHTTATVSQSVR